MKKLALLAFAAVTIAFLPACRTEEPVTHTTTSTTETTSMHTAPSTTTTVHAAAY